MSRHRSDAIDDDGVFLRALLLVVSAVPGDDHPTLSGCLKWPSSVAPLLWGIFVVDIYPHIYIYEILTEKIVSYWMALKLYFVVL
jgi:hypothetical protein